MNGYFPLFPWMAYPLVGFAVGKATIIECDAAVRSKNQRMLSSLGVVLMAAGAGGFLVNRSAELSGTSALYISPLSFYPVLILWDRVEGVGTLEWVVSRFVPRNQ